MLLILDTAALEKKAILANPIKRSHSLRDSSIGPQYDARSERENEPQNRKIKENENGYRLKK